MSRFQKLVIVLLAALVVIVGVVGVVVIQQQKAAAEQADYERCMAIHGFTPENPGTDLEALAEAAEACLS